jgi:hypothetical protein
MMHAVPRVRIAIEHRHRFLHSSGPADGMGIVLRKHQMFGVGDGACMPRLCGLLVPVSWIGRLERLAKISSQLLRERAALGSCIFDKSM